jgi:hypothetical protein
MPRAEARALIKSAVRASTSILTLLLICEGY